METGSEEQTWGVDAGERSEKQDERMENRISYAGGQVEATITTTTGSPMQQFAGGDNGDSGAEVPPNRMIFSWDYGDEFWWCKDKSASAEGKMWMPYVETDSRPAAGPRWK